MPTSWKIQEKDIASGPDWDAMDTDDTDDYDALTAHYWDWSSDWTFGEKIGASSPTWTVLSTQGYIGSPWANVDSTWADHDDSWLLISWTITTNTKTITGTET